MVREGSDASLECQATGNPLTATMVTWRRAGFDMEGRTIMSSAPGMASLYVKNISRNDTGAFECVANNGIGGESVEKTWLVATCELLNALVCFHYPLLSCPLLVLSLVLLIFFFFTVLIF